MDHQPSMTNLRAPHESWTQIKNGSGCWQLRQHQGVNSRCLALITNSAIGATLAINFVRNSFHKHYHHQTGCGFSRNLTRDCHLPQLVVSNSKQHPVSIIVINKPIWVWGPAISSKQLHSEGALPIFCVRICCTQRGSARSAHKTALGGVNNMHNGRRRRFRNFSAAKRPFVQLDCSFGSLISFLNALLPGFIFLLSLYTVKASQCTAHSSRQLRTMRGNNPQFGLFLCWKLAFLFLFKAALAGPDSNWQDVFNHNKWMKHKCFNKSNIFR